MHVLIKTGKKRRQRRCATCNRIVRICWRGEIGRETQRVIQIPVHRKRLAVIVVCQGKPAAHNRLASIAEKGVQQSSGRARGPRQSNAWLEVVLVPVVHGLPAINWPRPVNDDRVAEVIPLSGRSQALLKIRPQRDCGLNFKSLSLVDGALQTVAKSKGKR